MFPFFLFVTATLVLRGLGSVGVKHCTTWRACVCIALAMTFTFTGATHFTSMKHDYASMIPSGVPRRMELVSLSGAAELLGAAGLLVPRWRRAAGVGLALLLFAVFPANVHASLDGVPFRGSPPTTLWLRAPIQVVFLLALWFAAIAGGRPGVSGGSADAAG